MLFVIIWYDFVSGIVCGNVWNIDLINVGEFCLFLGSFIVFGWTYNASAM